MLLSVIVPIYNVDKYLKQCLDSLISQSFKDMQIICVNDGSKDNSLSIVLEYAKNDSRIEVIDKENSGYGHSCNLGIKKALGKYIAIVEPDDFISPLMYEKLLELAQKNDIDIIKCGYYEYFGGKSCPSLWTQNIKPPKEVFEIKEYPKILFYHPSIWAGMYKREFLLKNKIEFVEAKGAGWVDNPFFIETMCLAKKIFYTKEPYYFYRQDNLNASSHLLDFRIPLARIEDMNRFLKQHQELSICILEPILKKYIRYLLLSLYVGKNQKVSTEKLKYELYQSLDAILCHFKISKILKIRFLGLRLIPLGWIYHLYCVLRWIKYRF